MYNHYASYDIVMLIVGSWMLDAGCGIKWNCLLGFHTYGDVHAGLPLLSNTYYQKKTNQLAYGQ